MENKFLDDCAIIVFLWVQKIKLELEFYGIYLISKSLSYDSTIKKRDFNYPLYIHSIETYTNFVKYIEHDSNTIQVRVKLAFSYFSMKNPHRVRHDITAKESKKNR